MLLTGLASSKSQRVAVTFSGRSLRCPCTCAVHSLENVYDNGCCPIDMIPVVVISHTEPYLCVLHIRVAGTKRDTIPWFRSRGVFFSVLPIDANSFAAGGSRDVALAGETSRSQNGASCAQVDSSGTALICGGNSAGCAHERESVWCKSMAV